MNLHKSDQYTAQLKKHDQFRAVENNIEQCFAANIVGNVACQQYCSVLLHLIAG